MKTTFPLQYESHIEDDAATHEVPKKSSPDAPTLFIDDDMADIDGGIHFWDVDNGDGIIFIEEDIFSDYTEENTQTQGDYLEFDLELGNAFDFDLAMDSEYSENTVDVLLAQGADFNTIASSMSTNAFDGVDMVVFGANSNKVAGETMHDIFANLDGVQRCTHDKVSIDDNAWRQGQAEHNLGGKTYVEFTNDNDVSILIAKTSLEISHS